MNNIILYNKIHIEINFYYKCHEKKLDYFKVFTEIKKILKAFVLMVKLTTNKNAFTSFSFPN